VLADRVSNMAILLPTFNKQIALKKSEG
jgi:hypothetical protein